MERNTHPVVLVPAVIGGLALVAVMGMFLMMSGMRMLDCWTAGLLDCWTTEIRGALPITTLLVVVVVVVVVVALNSPQPRSTVQQAISEHRGLALAPHLLIRDAS